MAVFQAYRPVSFPSETWYGDVVEQSGDRIIIQSYSVIPGVQLRSVYEGDFAYTRDGMTGTVDTITQLTDGSAEFRAFDLDADAATIQDLQSAGSDGIDLFFYLARGDDTFRGSYGDDQMFGGRGQDRLDGRGGADLLHGGSGRDVMHGGTGEDSLLGGSGSDRITGGRGDDLLSGQAGQDRLHGGAGSDGLFGGRGGDRLEGGIGADVLVGEGGNDRMTGGRGPDVFVFTKGRDVITDFGIGSDFLLLEQDGPLGRWIDEDDDGWDVVNRHARVEDGDAILQFGRHHVVIEDVADLGFLAWHMGVTDGA